VKLLKASDLEVISGEEGKGGLRGVLPCGHAGFMEIIASREDLEPVFICSDRSNCGQTRQTIFWP